MSRIPPDENIQLPTGETVSFGTMSTLFRTMAQRPEIMQHSMQLLEAVAGGACFPGQLLLLLNGRSYCLGKAAGCN